MEKIPSFNNKERAPETSWSGESPSGEELRTYLTEWKAKMKPSESSPDKVSTGEGMAEYSPEEWEATKAAYEVAIALADTLKIQAELSNPHDNLDEKPTFGQSSLKRTVEVDAKLVAVENQLQSEKTFPATIHVDTEDVDRVIGTDIYTLDEGTPWSKVQDGDNDSGVVGEESKGKAVNILSGHALEEAYKKLTAYYHI